jgi:DNA-binding PadR family transcriptional regulator
MVNESILYRTTLDGLSSAALTALIDFSEGSILALFQDMWTYHALEKRGLVQSHWDESDAMKAVGMKYTGEYYTLTDYGRAFVAWYRRPKDLPIQMDMFTSE